MLAPYLYALFFVSALLALSCRGERTPRDYENSPPAMTHPADKASEVPHTPPAAVDAEPSYGAQGTSGPYQTTTNPSSPKPAVPPQKGLPPNAISTPHPAP